MNDPSEPSSGRIIMDHDTTSRWTREAQELFGRSVTRCEGVFSCSHNRIRGRLFVTPQALLFHSSLLGFETRIALQFQDILDIELFRTTSISVRTFDCEMYVFKSFENRRRTLQLLLTFLSSDGTLGNARQRSASSSSSAPLMNGPETATATNDALQPTVSQLPPQPSEPASSLNHGNRVHHAPMGNRRRCLSDSVVSEGSGRETTNSTQPPTDQSPPASVCSDNEGEKVETWQDVIQCPPLSEEGVESLELPCSLDAFFDLFLADNAPHSLVRYQSEHIQDRDVAATPWQQQPLGSESSPTHGCWTRTVAFSKLIKATVGFGPTQARTIRQQSLWRFSPDGLLLQNTTRVTGIPAADTFVVRDRWIVRAQPSPTSVRLSSSFELVFTKRSLFRGIIEKNVKKETREWWQGYQRMLCGATTDVVPQRTAPPAEGESSQPTTRITTDATTLQGTREQLQVLGLICVALLVVLLAVVVQSMFMLQEMAALRRLMERQCPAIV